MTRSRIYPSALPPFSAGMKIGLYGGSFNPAHDGHRHVALMAMKRLGLDCVWCLVTPGNPLKDIKDLPTLTQRMADTAKKMDHPAIVVTGVEQKANTRFTAESLDWILQRTPGVQFVWVMGGDNLNQFHKWQRWESIMMRIPVAIIDRPGYSRAPLYALAARRFDWARIPAHRQRTLAQSQCPAWSFLYGPRSALSSTALRRRSETASSDIEQQP